MRACPQPAQSESLPSCLQILGALEKSHARIWNTETKWGCQSYRTVVSVKWPIFLVYIKLNTTSSNIFSCAPVDQCWTPHFGDINQHDKITRPRETQKSACWWWGESLEGLWNPVTLFIQFCPIVYNSVGKPRVTWTTSVESRTPAVRYPGHVRDAHSGKHLCHITAGHGVSLCSVFIKLCCPCVMSPAGPLKLSQSIQ